MNKDMLEEPLKETQSLYQKYLAENKDKLSAEDFQRYAKQFEYVNALLLQLQTNPENKEKLISLFEGMQAQGDPPKEVLSTDNPFLNFNTSDPEQCAIF